MAIVLRSEVDVHRGFFSIGGTPAIMDIHDDGRFVLVEVEPQSGNYGRMLIDSPVHAIRVGGASTYLTIRFNGLKTRVDFAGRSPVGFGALGLVGAAIAHQYASKAGLPDWVAIFRQQGVLKGYSNTMRNVLILLGIVVVLVVGMFVIVAIAESGTR